MQKHGSAEIKERGTKGMENSVFYGVAIAPEGVMIIHYDEEGNEMARGLVAADFADDLLDILRQDVKENIKDKGMNE